MYEWKLVVSKNNSTNNENDKLKLLYENFKYTLQSRIPLQISNSILNVHISYFGDTSVTELEDAIASSYYLPGSSNVLERNEFNSNHTYFVGVGYPMKKGGDTQTNFTGSRVIVSNGKFAKAKLTAIRECGEEGGFIFPPSKMKLVYDCKKKYCGRMKHVIHYMVNAKDCNSLTEEEVSKFTPEKRKDEKSEKVVVWIFGSFKTCKALISASNHKYRSKDITSYLSIVPCEKVKAWCYFSKNWAKGRNKWKFTETDVISKMCRYQSNCYKQSCTFIHTNCYKPMIVT